MERQTQQPMTPPTLQLLEPQIQHSPDLQIQQPLDPQIQQQIEDEGSNTAAGSSAITPIRPTSIRWAPTPDQLRILQELYYDKAFKYPTPKKIQEICLQLKQYGQVEGMNVYFWFQNLRARERQKMRLIQNVRVGGSLDLNFGSTSSTDDGGSIALNFGSWVGHSVDPYSSSPFNTNTSTSTIFFGINEEQTFMEQRGEDHQEIETLPLFPMHGEDIFSDLKTTSEGGSGYGYCSGGSGGYNGGSHISLELSLNPSGAADLA